MMTNAFKYIISAIALFVLFVFYIRRIERQSLFIPQKTDKYLVTPKNCEDVTFTACDGVKLHGWYVPVPEAEFTVLMCHGNGGNLSHRVDKVEFFTRRGLSVFIFDYRGYGLSKGAPSEKGLYRDVQAAYDFLISRSVAPERIIGFGESLGGAVIIELAGKNKIAGLYLVCTFANIRELAKKYFPFVPVALMDSQFDSIAKIKHIAVPKTIIASVNDEIIPFAFGKSLYDAASGPKEFFEVHGSHNTCFYETPAKFDEALVRLIGMIKGRAEGGSHD